MTAPGAGRPGPGGPAEPRHAGAGADRPGPESAGELPGAGPAPEDEDAGAGPASAAPGTGWPPTGRVWPAPGTDPGAVAPGPLAPDPSQRGAPEQASPAPGSAAEMPADADAAVTPADVLAALVARGETVAVAESLTGGLLTAALTEPAGASAAVRGGVVVYTTDLKATLAGVPTPLLHAEGPVSPDVAGALAAGARDRLGATYGLGVTGVAGPDAQGGVEVGTVFVGLAGPGGGQVRRLALAGDRAAIRAATVRAALALLAAALRAGSSESSG